jgi:translation initiation factor IF-2
LTAPRQAAAGRHISALSFPSSAAFSSRPGHDPKRNEKSTTKRIRKDEEEPNKDALTVFFERRKAMLEEKNQNGQQQKHQNNRNADYRKSSSNRSNEGRESGSLADMMREMSEKRASNQDQSFRQRRQSNNYYSNNNTQSNRYDNRRKNNHSQFQHDYNRRQNNPNFSRNNAGNSNNHPKKEEGGTDRISRLADVMQKLRRDLPTNATKPNTDRPLPFSRENNHPRSSFKPSWQQQQQQQQQDSSFPKLREQRQRQQQRPQRPQEQSRADFLSRTRADDNPTAPVTSPPTEPTNRVVALPPASLTITEVSTLFRIKVDDIKAKLSAMGAIEEVRNSEDVDVDVDAKKKNDSSTFMVDVDMMELLAMEFGFETERSEETVILDADELLMQQRRTTAMEENATKFPPRPPVVTIMGHVDHGKTTLMDALRRESMKQMPSGGKASKKGSKKIKKQGDTQSGNVAGTEAGGITQIISAFQVALEGQENKITFLDTPGHAAFTAMRQSGSHAADVIVLVIAADDGISPQTVEIIDTYKSIVKGSSDSGISMVVALNKIDKPGIDADEAKMRIENQLLEHGIISEGMKYSESELEFGQPVQVIPTSGLTGQGLDDLMEGLLLQSEVMDLRADDEADAEGIIMDARIEKGLGVVVDCIIRWGKIEKGDVVISGDQIARVRMLKDVNDKVLQKGIPSQPVRIIGFKSLPKAGDPIMVVESEEVAEEIVEQRQQLSTSESDRPEGQGDVEIQIHNQRRGDSWRIQKVHEKAALEESDGSIRIPIIVKADADGSLSAVRDSLVDLGKTSDHFVVVDPVSEGIGEITSSDIQMAKESEATIFAFGLKRMDQGILNLAESEGVQICSSDIIYSLLDNARDSLGSYLPATPKKHVHGKATVKAIFQIDTPDGKEKIAGLRVTDGTLYKTKAPLKDDDSELKCHFRILRDGKQVSPEGETVSASSLRRFKELVDSVRLGDECGLGLSGFESFEEGDEIECYSIEMKKAKL